MVLSAFPLASLELDLLGNLGRWNAPAVVAHVQPCHPHLFGHAATGRERVDRDRVSARESSRLVGSDTFKLTITPVNDAPIVSTPIADQSIAEDTTGRSRFRPAPSPMWTIPA